MPCFLKKLQGFVGIPDRRLFSLMISFTYSPTCIKQAPRGQSKSACLRQVLA